MQYNQSLFRGQIFRSGVAMGYHIFSPKMILQVIVESGVKHHQTNRKLY